MLGFIFGLAVGGMAASGSVATPPASVHAMLSQIPLRCYAALDESEEAYNICRRPSLIAELNTATTINQGSYSTCYKVWTVQGQTSDVQKSYCDLNKNIAWEVHALRALEAASKAK